ncbi:MAG: sodium:solute symporter family protein [Nanoarchaeota archaeon]|nr:sodium:solute symporter family protein [Nanoarchaeota archaeon]
MSVTLIVLLLYLLLTFGIAWYFSRRESLEAYFINSRRTGLWLLLFSNVATIVGAGFTVGVVAEVFNSGISYGFALPISAVLGVIFMGLFAGMIKRMGDKYHAYTIVDFFAHRFDKRSSILVGILQVFMLIVTLGIQAIATATLASVLVGVDYRLSLLLAAAVTILYTTMGGLKIDIITDFVQFWVITVVFVIMGVVLYRDVGSLSSLLGRLPVGHLDIFAFGGVSWFVGVIVMAGFITLGNGYHWQRVFSAVDDRVARKSFFWSVPFMLVLSVLVLFFGLVAAGSLSDIPKESALFVLMSSKLPSWLTGLGFAAILAVIMSSVDSLIVNGATILFRAVHKKAVVSSRREVWHARLFTAGFGVVGYVLAFVVPDIVLLTLFVAYLTIVFIPPIFAGFFASKVSGRAVFYALLFGSLVLAATFVWLPTTSFIFSTLTSVVVTFGFDRVF